ncbi:MAG: hypothetical protein A2X49_13520 [Lentisphaerae bacterium GWF2_52_8]|nr:MAG: hypothetical protein A2X49_13520 [Lentisphaerae bacterium GWF2_52_8]
MGKSTASYILPALFLLSIPVLVLGGGAWFLYKSYENQKSALIKAIKDLPKFNAEEEARKAAAELKLPYPPPKPSEPLESVIKKLQDSCKEKAKEKFSAKELSKATLDLLRKYSSAKIGDKIVFQLENTNETITGIYRGKEDQGKGPVIVVDSGLGDTRYPILKIMPEYHHLFSEADSRVAQEKRISALKEEFEEGRAKYIQQLYDEAETKVLSDAGYLQNDKGKWLNGFELLDEIVKKRRSKYETKYVQDVRELIEKRRFLNFFEISIPEELKALPSSNNSGMAKAEEKTGGASSKDAASER